MELIARMRFIRVPNFICIFGLTDLFVLSSGCDIVRRLNGGGEHEKVGRNFGARVKKEICIIYVLCELTGTSYRDES